MKIEIKVPVPPPVTEVVVEMTIEELRGIAHAVCFLKDQNCLVISKEKVIAVLELFRHKIPSSLEWNP